MVSIGRLAVMEILRDSLTELENFIDSYAAEDTDDEDGEEDHEQQKMINLLRQQMMTNLTLMNTLNKNTIPTGKLPYIRA